MHWSSVLVDVLESCTAIQHNCFACHCLYVDVNLKCTVASLIFLCTWVSAAATHNPWNRFCCTYPQLIRGVKVRPPAQEQGSGSSAAGKHKLMCPAGPEKASVPEDAGVDGVSGACKERSPQGVRRARQQGTAAMSQMAVSI